MNGGLFMNERSGHAPGMQNNPVAVNRLYVDRKWTALLRAGDGASE
jgi:hypothetical protein